MRKSALVSHPPQFILLPPPLLLDLLPSEPLPPEVVQEPLVCGRHAPRIGLLLGEPRPLALGGRTGYPLLPLQLLALCPLCLTCLVIPPGICCGHSGGDLLLEAGFSLVLHPFLFHFSEVLSQPVPLNLSLGLSNLFSVSGFLFSLLSFLHISEKAPVLAEFEFLNLVF